MTDHHASDLSWGSLDEGEVRLYSLASEGGARMQVTNYGATIVSLHVPDRDGKLADIVLGYDRLEDYVTGTRYFGCIAGRCANRIAGGEFVLDGKTITLSRNEGAHHLHGGTRGFGKHVWSAEARDTRDGPAIRFTRVSPDGEEGYPGNLEVAVTYTLTHENALAVEMHATTDAPTLCNLAQHNYWNLAGHDAGDVLGHRLRLEASRYTPVDDALIPLGTRKPVEDTPYDFTESKPIGERLAEAGGDPPGYDVNLVVNGRPHEMRLVARVTEPTTGRILELSADQPGYQLYSGNHLDGTDPGKGGARYIRHAGFCLETQHHPDSIHHPEWPSVVLRPDEEYRHRMLFRFRTRQA